MITALVFREERRPSTLLAHKRVHTSMVANSHLVLLLLPMNRCLRRSLLIVSVGETTGRSVRVGIRHGHNNLQRS